MPTTRTSSSMGSAPSVESGSESARAVAGAVPTTVPARRISKCSNLFRGILVPFEQEVVGRHQVTEVRDGRHEVGIRQVNVVDAHAHRVVLDAARLHREHHLLQRQQVHAAHVGERGDGDDRAPPGRIQASTGDVTRKAQDARVLEALRLLGRMKARLEVDVRVRGLHPEHEIARVACVDDHPGGIERDAAAAPRAAKELVVARRHPAPAQGDALPVAVEKEPVGARAGDGIAAPRRVEAGGDERQPPLAVHDERGTALAVLARRVTPGGREVAGDVARRRGRCGGARRFCDIARSGLWWRRGAATQRAGGNERSEAASRRAEHGVGIPPGALAGPTPSPLPPHPAASKGHGGERAIRPRAR